MGAIGYVIKLSEQIPSLHLSGLEHTNPASNFPSSPHSMDGVVIADVLTCSTHTSEQHISRRGMREVPGRFAQRMRGTRYTFLRTTEASNYSVSTGDNIFNHHRNTSIHAIAACREATSGTSF
jgi:hypothetical protein